MVLLMNMNIIFPVEESPVIVRKFDNLQELETWYKDTHYGKELPKTDNKAVQARDTITAFYNMMESLQDEKTRLNCLRNILEIVPEKETPVITKRTECTIINMKDEKKRQEFKQVIIKEVLTW